ncbi:RNA ligase family protein [Glycomyces sp. MUSA5-2]|uniref:RNA ligase family protein n=1 Tax=Glycomyces sp. MUSA5-2 TaxID=2053002 RepID=UPI0030092DA5
MNLDFAALDTATAYPSIPTYHVIGERGMLGDATNVTFQPGEDILLTEKVDGANCRMIILPDNDYVIGNRKQLLYARGDRLANQSEDNLAMVAALRPAAERLAEVWQGDTVLVVYAEVFGAGIGRAWTQYTADKTKAGARWFDARTIPPTVLTWSLDRIAGWRERGHEGFAPVSTEIADSIGLKKVPPIATCDGDDIPTGRDETEQWMADLIPASCAGIDESGTGAPEGLVARTNDRSKIVKFRFAEYAKTRRQLANRR